MRPNRVLRAKKKAALANSAASVGPRFAVRLRGDEALRRIGIPVPRRVRRRPQRMEAGILEELLASAGWGPAGELSGETVQGVMGGGEGEKGEKRDGTEGWGGSENGKKRAGARDSKEDGTARKRQRVGEGGEGEQGGGEEGVDAAVQGTRQKGRGGARDREEGGAGGERRAARLMTHVWHAKRMAMRRRWGMSLCEGAQGRGRGSRAVLQSMKRGHVLHDSSYHGWVALEGATREVGEVLRGCVDGQRGDDPAVEPFCSGAGGAGVSG